VSKTARRVSTEVMLGAWRHRRRLADTARRRHNAVARQTSEWPPQ